MPRYAVSTMWSRRALLAAVLQSGKAADLTRLSLAEVSALVHRRTVSPVELTQACLLRIERLNPALNAFVTVQAEDAMREARVAEAEIRSGRWRGPLHGVPIALKDLIHTAGVRTTAGSAILKDHLSREDAEVVRRLKAAGAVLLGKLNMHEFAYGDTSVASFFGPVHNPWSRLHIAGGSSGGSAAAVAAGLCYGALGSDTGGSIRQPAAYCSIVGLKPTYGRVSLRGVIPLAWSLDHVGPMCRTVGDTALLLQTIAGYDPQDVSSVDVPVPGYVRALRGRVSALRVGIPRAIFFADLDPEIDAAIRKAIDVLRTLTTSIRDVNLPEIPSLPIVGAEAYAYHAGYLAKTPELYQPQTRDRLAQGAKVTTEAYIRARLELDVLRRSIREVFADIDVLVTPTTPTVPPTIALIQKLQVVPPLSLRNTRRFNFYGLPTISVPCGFTHSGLPIGLQISAPHWAESRVLALARAYEKSTEWHTRQPAV